MTDRDLRDWLKAIDELGELRHVSGAHWDGEIGALAEIARRETKHRPVVLFDKIVGYPEGYRVVVGQLSTVKRIAFTCGIPSNGDHMGFIKAWREKLKSMVLVPPEVVSTAPVLENVHQGSDINLLEFPVPKWHEMDGGRYIGTGDAAITRDPVEGWVNVGTYRVQVHGPQTLGLFQVPGKQGWVHRENYFKLDRPCPIAISFGHDPLLFLVAAAEIPDKVSEYDFAGGLRGKAIQVINGPVTGLPIPASSEIVIEGEMVPGDTAIEGPFGEWTGYYGSAARPQPVIRVRSLMHRNNPIISGAPPSIPPTEGTLHISLIRSAMIWDAMENVGIPDVKGVFCHEEGGSRLITVVSIKQRFPGHVKQAALVASQCYASAYMLRYLIMVDEDINPADIHEVLWAMATRSDPARDIDIMRRCWSGPLDTAIADPSTGFNSRAIIDACKPYESLRTFPAVVRTSPELRGQVMAKWGEILFN